MNLTLFEKIDKLNYDIRNSIEYKEYKDAKDRLENDETAIKLTIKKDKLIMKYEDNLKFSSRNDPMNLLIQKEIKDTLEELNKLDIVKEYKEKENKINEIIDLINKEIFDIWLELMQVNIRVEK